MHNLNKSLYMPKFSHIYIEKQVQHTPLTSHILQRFPRASIIYIDHYKDVFNRSKQHFAHQKQTMKLILAHKQEPFLYKGSDVAQDFGFDHFFYTSSILNCLYNCEYCFLQGMFPSGNIVMFVNIEDYFESVQHALDKHSLYVCISYESDLLALEGIAPFASKWLTFAAQQRHLTIELRTKSTNVSPILRMQPSKNIILAWTLSPQAVIEKYEHDTPSLQARLQAIRQVMDAGWNVRLSFDPVLHVHDWQAHYLDMVHTTFDQLHSHKIVDISIGTFRMSADYLKRMRKENKFSPLIHYPFETINGVSSYPSPLAQELVEFVHKHVQAHFPQEHIYPSSF